MSAASMWIPGAIRRPSIIPHPVRSFTLGGVLHWTVGHEPGDVFTLQGRGARRVDCHLYSAKDGDLYQFLPLNSEAWHAFDTANRTCVGIEHESSGEAYTPAQLATSAEAMAYVCKAFAIPIVHVDPSGHDLSTFRGLFGHRDLSLGGERVDGNDHTDTYPGPGGWDTYLGAVRKAAGEALAPRKVDLSTLPGSNTLRLGIGGRLFAGWEDAAGPILWVARNGAEDPDAVIAWQRRKYLGPVKVEHVCRNLARRFLKADV